MSNSYEMAQVLELGTTQQQIRGCKPPLPPECDVWLGCGYRTQPDACDIDESDD